MSSGFFGIVGWFGVSGVSCSRRDEVGRTFAGLVVVIESEFGRLFLVMVESTIGGDFNGSEATGPSRVNSSVGKTRRLSRGTFSLRIFFSCLKNSRKLGAQSLK